MICPNCGSRVSDNGKFCTNCGTILVQEEQETQSQQPSYQESQSQQPSYQGTQSQQYQQPQYQAPQPQQYVQYQQSDTSLEYHGHPMKWYKFMIYFGLFAGAVVNAFSAVKYFTGSSYGADLSYVAANYPGLRVADAFLGAGCFVIAVLLIIARFALAKFAKNGPALLYLAYGINLGCSVIYLLSASAILGNFAVFTSSIPNLIATAAMLVINITYFNKRMDLFVN